MIDYVGYSSTDKKLARLMAKIINLCQADGLTFYQMRMLAADLTSFTEKQIRLLSETMSFQTIEEQG